MGFFAFLDVDNGEMLSIDEKDINVGTPLTAFLETYGSSFFCSEDSIERQWFERLEEQSRLNPRILTEIYYGEEMRYSPDEYYRFLFEWGRIYDNFGEAEFKKALEDVEKMWTPIDELLPVVEEIIRLLPQMGEDTHWYKAEDTQPAFHGLRDTLNQARNKDGKKVRILIR